MSGGLFDYEPREADGSLYENDDAMTAHIISCVDMMKKAAALAGVSKEEFDESVVEMLVDLITDAHDVGYTSGQNDATERLKAPQDERVAELEKLLAEQYTRAHSEGHAIGRAKGLREAADLVRDMSPGRNIQARMANQLAKQAEALMKDYVGPGETSIVKSVKKGGKK